ncbi:MAG: MtnX-like HAD-IB family phosphatase [FCB group bacterium]|nr:MtnX-like HAD-IB family phosphatase [FCB group bacterium]
MPNQSEIRQQPVIFTDFDGTISIGDVGNRLFQHFSDGRSGKAVDLWLAGKIDSRQCLEEEGQSLRDVTAEELFDFFDGFAIDPDFSPFVDFCRDSGWPLYILSDGLDIYIHRILKSHGLTDLAIYANRAELVEGRLRFSYPYYENSCGNCANCKGYQLRRLRRDGRKAVYIGDGKSDLCALPEADLVFAKGYLAEHCRINGLDHMTFDGFKDITKILRSQFA